MALFKSRHVFDQLDDLLDKERDAVLNGDFESLRRLADKKERAVVAASRCAGPSERLLSLKRKADRNRQLLTSAGDGIRAASDFLKKLEQPDDSLRTYDQSGSLRSHAAGHISTERRA